MTKVFVEQPLALSGSAKYLKGRLELKVHFTSEDSHSEPEVMYIMSTMRQNAQNNLTLNTAMSDEH